MSNKDLISQLRQEKAKWLDKIAAIDQTIELLSDSSTYHGISNYEVAEDGEDSPNKVSPKEAILIVLKDKQRFVKSRAFAEKMAEINGVPYESAYKRISPTLSGLRKKGLIRKVQIGTEIRNTFWGSNNWVDQEGNIIKDYIYEEDINKETLQIEFDI